MKFLICIMIIAVSMSALPISASVFVDKFDGSFPNNWFWTTSIRGSGPKLMQKNGRLEVTLPADSKDDPARGGFDAGYVSAGVLRGDFDIQVDYTLLECPKENGTRVGLSASFGSVERSSSGTVHEYPESLTNIYAANFGASTITARNYTGTEDRSGKLRLIRSGYMATGYYYRSGEWITIGSGIVGTDDASFTIRAWSHNYTFAGKQMKAAFDNFVINSGTLVLSDTRSPSTVRLMVPATSSNPVAWTAPETGVYKITASGLWLNRDGALETDAAGYQNFGKMNGSPDQWSLAIDLPYLPAGWIELLINDLSAGWGEFNPDHIYTIRRYLIAGRKLEFRIADSYPVTDPRTGQPMHWFYDNAGFLTVDISPLTHL